MNRTSTLLCLSMLLCALPLTAHAQDSTKPVHGYRITYSFITSDAGKRSGTESFTMTVNTAPITLQDGRSYTGRGQIKVGQRVPIQTSAHNDSKTGVLTEFTYIDVGTTIDATITESPTGLLLASKVEKSGVAPEPVVIENVKEPLIRQEVLTNSSTIVAGKPVRVGSMDLPDSQRHIDIEVTVQPL